MGYCSLNLHHVQKCDRVFLRTKIAHISGMCMGKQCNMNSPLSSCSGQLCVCVSVCVCVCVCVEVSDLGIVCVCVSVEVSDLGIVCVCVSVEVSDLGIVCVCVCVCVCVV